MPVGSPSLEAAFSNNNDGLLLSYVIHGEKVKDIIPKPSTFLSTRSLSSSNLPQKKITRSVPKILEKCKPSLCTPKK